MSIKAVLFDLDGTLLPMDQNVFIKTYFSGLCRRIAPYGYEPQRLIDSIWAGTFAMVRNDGSKRNEEVFWDTIVAIYGEKIKEMIPVFDAFYREDFDSVRTVCGYDARARQVVSAAHAKGLRTVLATSPIFPAAATERRIRWAGLKPEDFELYTTYENASYCKPNPAYYSTILTQMNLLPEECLMVGNDVGDDMIAKTLGMQVFLLTDCIINQKNEDISLYPSGGFDELLSYIDQL